VRDLADFGAPKAMKLFLRRRAPAEHHGTHGDAARTLTPPTQHSVAAATSTEDSGGLLSAATLAQAAMTSPQALAGVEMPAIMFNNFDRRFLDLREIAAHSLVLYVYPGCERSPGDGAASLGADAMQHRTYCALRKRFAEAMPGGALVALSSISPTQQFHQSPELAWDQDEDAPFQHYLVSDETLQLAEELQLPTFQHDGETYYERLTLIAHEGRIQRVFHPVTAGQDARQALTWLQLR
jgi:peroxiredoxin